MNSFWNDPDGASIKDVIGVIMGTLFTGIAILAVTSGDVERRMIALQILQTISPIVISIVGGYAITEGTRGAISTYYQNKNVSLQQAYSNTTTPANEMDVHNDENGEI
jgi:hypothetical protein